MTVANRETCTRLAEAVQEILDGVVSSLPAALDAHRQQCAECRSLCDAMDRMRAGLRQQVRPPMPAEMTQRVLAAVIADRASPVDRAINWRRTLTWMSIAAAVFIGMGILVPQVVLSGRSEKAISATAARKLAPDRRNANSLDLRENLATASDAIVSLTRRTTEDVVEPTRGLLSFEMTAPWLKPSDAIPNAIDPAAQSLEEVRQGAAAGFEPMTTSARRAFAMFTRDLPAKPGS